MNPEFFSNSRLVFDKIENIYEAKGHLDHPEDLIILKGVSGAKQAINAILATSKNPKAVTIKWDGYPALLFGTGLDRKFTVLDKHMMNKEDGSGRRIYSPEQFAQYDEARGVERHELNQLINSIWPGLKKSYSGAGWYWGDLIFSQPLEPQKDGLYHFKANPNGIAYTVDPNSEVGKLITGKQAGIAVHQYLDPDAPEKAKQMSRPGKKVYPTDLAKSLNGTIGSLKNDTNVAIVPSAMPIVPKISVDKTLIKNAQDAITKYGRAVEELLNNAPQARNSFNQLFTKFINSRIESGNLSDLSNEFLTYFENYPMTVSMKQKLADHLNANKQGIIGLFTIWATLYQLKMNVVEQLNVAAENSPVKGYLQSGQQSQEGFVSQGVKFIDRLGFSRQNLAGKR